MEKDQVLRKRLEEEASPEMQQGWRRGTKKTSHEFEREAREAEIQAQREAEIENLLNQPRVMTRDGQPPEPQLFELHHANTFPLVSKDKASADKRPKPHNQSVLGEGFTESPR